MRIIREKCMEMRDEKASCLSRCHVMFLIPASFTRDLPAWTPVSTNAACLFFLLCGKWRRHTRIVSSGSGFWLEELPGRALSLTCL